MRDFIWPAFTNLNGTTNTHISLDTLTIYSPSITLNLRNIIQRYVQQNFSWTKQILQTKKLVVAFIPAFTTIVYFSWLSGDVPRLQSYGIYISQLVRFARYCSSVLDAHSKNHQITLKRELQISFEKTFGKYMYFRSYPDLLSKFGEILFEEYVSERIPRPVFFDFGGLVYKLRRVKCVAKFVSSGSKTIKPIRRRRWSSRGL